MMCTFTDSSELQSILVVSNDMLISCPFSIRSITHTYTVQRPICIEGYSLLLTVFTGSHDCENIVHDLWYSLSCCHYKSLPPPWSSLSLTKARSTCLWKRQGRTWRLCSALSALRLFRNQFRPVVATCFVRNVLIKSPDFYTVFTRAIIKLVVYTVNM